MFEFKHPFYETIIEKIKDGLLILDSQGKILKANKLATKILKKKKLEGLEIDELIKDFSKKVTKAETFEIILERPIRFFQVISSFLPFGKKKNILLIFRDLTKEKALEVARKDFLMIASHQLKTPLATIRGYLSMLKEGLAGRLKKEQTKFLNKIDQAASLMDILINDLLVACKGEETIKPLYFSIEEIIDDLLPDYKQKAKEKNLSFDFEKPKEKLPKLFLDPDKIRIALVNLLNNAFHYTEKGEVVLKIEKKDNRVIVSVKDTGIGIPEEEKGLIFSKFFRAKNAFTMKPTGTGLGLFVVKNIIEAHKGEIWFKSQEGKGSTFSFFLPLK